MVHNYFLIKDVSEKNELSLASKRAVISFAYSTRYEMTSCSVKNYAVQEMVSGGKV